MKSLDFFHSVQGYKTTLETKPADQDILCAFLLRDWIISFLSFLAWANSKRTSWNGKTLRGFSFFFFLQAAFFHWPSSINKHCRAIWGEDFPSPLCSTSLPFHFVLFASSCQDKHEALSGKQQVRGWHFLMFTEQPDLLLTATKRERRKPPVLSPKC